MLHAISIFFNDIFINLILIIFGISFCVFCIIKLGDITNCISDIISSVAVLCFKNFYICLFCILFMFFFCSLATFYIFWLQFMCFIIFCYRNFEIFSIRFDMLMMNKEMYNSYVASNATFKFLIFIGLFSYFLCLLGIFLLAICL